MNLGLEERYQLILTEGLAALEDGKFSPPHFPYNLRWRFRKLRNRFNTAVVFGEGRSTLIKKVCTPLTEHNLQAPLRFLVAGCDYPLHCTILEGVYPGRDWQDKYQSLVTGPDWFKICLSLVGQEIVFDDLLIDALGNILLVATHAPEAIMQARNDLGKLYDSEGLKVLLLNILHATIGRIAATTREKAGLLAFKDWFLPLRQSVREMPISVKVYYISEVLSAYQLLVLWQGE